MASLRQVTGIYLGILNRIIYYGKWVMLERLWLASDMQEFIDFTQRWSLNSLPGTRSRYFVKFKISTACTIETIDVWHWHK